MKPIWQTKKLFELAKFSQGIQVGLADQITYPLKGHVRFIRIVDYTQGTNDIRYIKDPGNKYHASMDDLVMVRYGSPGLIGRGIEGIIANNLFKITILNSEVTNDYLAYFLGQPDIQLYLSTQGASTMPALNFKQLGSVEINFPSVFKQERIVAILDEAFEGIAAAKANAEKNLKNARELFESHLQSVFSQSGEGWVEDKLFNLTTKIGSGATPRGGEESYKEVGISLIRSMNVHDFGFKYRKLAFIDTIQAKELSNVEIQSGDVLLNITGASVARCVIVPDDVLPARVNQHVSIIRVITDKVDANFLHFLLISKRYKDELLDTGSEGGSTRQAITKAQIQEFTITYPSCQKKQKVIVEKLKGVLVKTQRLESIYQQKIKALDELKKSLLHKAFSAQL